MQNGKDDEGYQGFLMKDIAKAEKSIKDIQCTICRKTGANIQCNVKHCRHRFHTNCALKVECNFQFEGSYPVYCPGHNKIKFKEERPLEAQCGICYDKLVKKKSILLPCCKNSWFHKNCLQKYAYTSGYYHFKCPLCADREKCIEELPKMGIFMPMRDAQWELDNDFADMAIPPEVTCEFCDSNEGAEDNHLWKMCDICGASGVHWTCLELTETQNFVCRHCNEILEKKASQSKIQTPRKKKRTSDDGYPVLYLASDEELCTTSEDEALKPRPSKQNPPSTSGSEKENKDIKPEPTKANMYDSSDEEIVKPKTKRRSKILSDSSSDEEEDLFIPKRKKPRAISSSPETPKAKSQNSAHRL